MGQCESTPARYFVEVGAPDEHALRRLRGFGLDLFVSTARRSGDAFAIDGLIGLDDVARLVSAGYPVLVAADAAKHERRLEVSEFPEWLAERLAERQA